MCLLWGLVFRVRELLVLGFGLLICFVGLAFRPLRGMGGWWIAGCYLSCNVGFDLLFVVCGWVLLIVWISLIVVGFSCQWLLLRV